VKINDVFIPKIAMSQPKVEDYSNHNGEPAIVTTNEDIPA
jgi:hypothetical protein